MTEENQPIEEGNEADVFASPPEATPDEEQPIIAGTDEAHPSGNAKSFKDVAEQLKNNGIDMLNDVELDVQIELGRANLMIEDVLRMNPGTVVELNKFAGDPVDVYVNEKLIARGEVLVLNDNFCVRISEIITELSEEYVDAGASNKEDVN